MNCSIEGCEKPAWVRTWCMAHYMAWRRHGDPLHQRASVEDRFFAKIAAGPNCCWIWTSTLRRGYGALTVKGRLVSAHRLSYEWHVGPIPEGLTIDHLCRTPRCVNPDHLEAVPSGVNTLRGEAVTAVHARKTSCAYGHPFDEQNTYTPPGTTYRICRKCARRRTKEWELRRAST